MDTHAGRSTLIARAMLLVNPVPSANMQFVLSSQMHYGKYSIIYHHVAENKKLHKYQLTIECINSLVCDYKGKSPC